MAFPEARLPKAAAPVTHAFRKPRRFISAFFMADLLIILGGRLETLSFFLHFPRKIKGNKLGN
jgi:hypothetical protein